MGIMLHFFSTAPGDMRPWMMARLRAWWAAWTQSSTEIGLSISPIDSFGKEDLDRLTASVDRLRPENGPVPYFPTDRPKHGIFRLAHRLLVEDNWKVPRSGQGIDTLVQHLLRDTDYHLRHPLEGDRIATLLAPMEPPHHIGHIKRPHFLKMKEFPPKTTPEIRDFWLRLRIGRSLAIFPQSPWETCTPDDYDRIHGWWSEEECRILLQGLQEIENESRFDFIKEMTEEALALKGGIGFLTG